MGKTNLFNVEQKHKGPVNFFRQLFISGLLVILPVWLTVWVIAVIFSWISAFSMPIFSPILKVFTSNSAWIVVLAKIASFFLTLIIICFVGYFTNKVLGKTILRYFETIFVKVPFVGSIYMSLKKLISFFSRKDNQMNFQKVVFIPFPNKASYCAAFSTGEQIIDGQKYITTFMPTTPNPTTGFLMLIKEEDIVESKYTVEEAIQYIMSAGIIKPTKDNV